MKRLLLIIFSFNVFSLYAQKSWTAVMSQGKLAQSYKSFFAFSDVETWIREKAKEGKVITELEYDNTKWYAVATEHTEKVDIAWQINVDFPQKWISDKWSDSKYITKVAWGDGKWVVIMTNKTSFNRQKWAVRNSWADIEKWIGETWRENTAFTITDLTYGNGKWACVLSILNSFEPQSYKVSKEFPSTWIQSKYDEKYNIRVVENDGENWYVVMNKKYSQLGETILKPESDFPESKIKEQWDKERRISGLVYSGKGGDDDWNDADLFAALFSADENSFDKFKKAGDEKLAAKNYIGAIVEYEKAIKIDDTNGEVWNNIAWARYLNGYCYSPLSDVNKSIKIKSNSYNNHTKAMILKCQKKCTDALPFFNEAIRLSRAENGKVSNIIYYTDRAEAKKCLKDYSGAIDDIELALAIEPTNSSLKQKLKELNALL